MSRSAEHVTPQPPRHIGHRECPIEGWLGFLGHRWNALLLWQLSQGPLRYHELQHALQGVSAKVLAERLEGLEARKLIARHVGNGFPREVTYRLTHAGEGLVVILQKLEAWDAVTAAADM